MSNLQELVDASLADRLRLEIAGAIADGTLVCHCPLGPRFSKARLAAEKQKRVDGLQNQLDLLAQVSGSTCLLLLVLVASKKYFASESVCRCHHQVLR